MRERESAVERRLVSGVKARGGLCWKCVSPGTSGVPDRIVVTRTGEIWFVELKADDGRLSPRQALILRQLKDGELDAGLVDSLAAYYFIYSSSGRYFVLSESLGDEKFSIGFRKKDKELRDRFQEIISAMKADGSLGKISKKWFGSDITIVR